MMHNIKVSVQLLWCLHVCLEGPQKHNIPTHVFACMGYVLFYMHCQDSVVAKCRTKRKVNTILAICRPTHKAISDLAALLVWHIHNTFRVTYLLCLSLGL